MKGIRTRRRLIGRWLTAVAVSDVAYRLFLREQVRRTLGIETRNA